MSFEITWSVSPLPPVRTSTDRLIPKPIGWSMRRPVFSPTMASVQVRERESR